MHVLSMKIDIQLAKQTDAQRLTQIAFAAKRTWNYPEDWIQLWEDELTITTKYILENKVWVGTVNHEVVGFCSLVYVPEDTLYGEILVGKGHWMDHLFIDPKYQHQGIGKQLWEYALTFGQENNISSLNIFVDPNAVGFYEKVGAKFVKDSPSSIPGRSLPIYQKKIIGYHN